MPDCLYFIFIGFILFYWVTTRTDRKKQQNQTDQRSTQDILLSIEDKLEKLVSIQNHKVE